MTILKVGVDGFSYFSFILCSNQDHPYDINFHDIYVSTKNMMFNSIQTSIESQYIN